MMPSSTTCLTMPAISEQTNEISVKWNTRMKSVPRREKQVQGSKKKSLIIRTIHWSERERFFYFQYLGQKTWCTDLLVQQWRRRWSFHGVVCWETLPLRRSSLLPRWRTPTSQGKCRSRHSQSAKKQNETESTGEHAVGLPEKATIPVAASGRRGRAKTKTVERRPEKKKRGPAKRWHVAGFGRRLFSASDVAAHVRGRPASRRGVCGAARPPNSTGAAGGPSDAAGTAGRHPTDGQRAKIQRRKFRRNGVEKWRDVLGGVAPSRGNVSTARKFASAFVRFLLDSRIISTSRQQRY